MELEQGEHSILSFFPSSDKAQEAAQAIEEAGLVPEPGAIQVDRITRYSSADEDEYNNPISNAATLSGITLYSASEGEEGTNPLLAAMDSASGIGNPNAGVPGRHGFMLTLVTAKENVEAALEIIRAYDGDT
ncbi:MAG TPA: hypothetical protein DD791_07805 [Syntrophomonas sp.]|jgi:hypothetical protein|nr:hypothetical protein [Syntrophomonas sp.]